MADDTIGKAGGCLEGLAGAEVVFRNHVIAPGGGYQDVHLWSFHRARWDTDLVRGLTGNPAAMGLGSDRLADGATTSTGTKGRRWWSRREEPVDIYEFIGGVQEILSAELPEDVNPYDNLYEDLGLDSFQAWELIVVTESLADCVVPPLEIVELHTLADAYDYYLSLRAADAELSGP